MALTGERRQHETGPLVVAQVSPRHGDDQTAHNVGDPMLLCDRHFATMPTLTDLTEQRHQHRVHHLAGRQERHG